MNDFELLYNKKVAYKKNMEDTIIQTKETYWGRFALIEFIPVSGVPLKADNYYVTFSLTIKGENIDGIFDDKYVIKDKHLFIVEMNIKKDDDGFGTLKSSSLIHLNLETHEKRIISKIDNGRIFPIKTEDDNIIYGKQRLHESATHEFEQKIKQS